MLDIYVACHRTSTSHILFVGGQVQRICSLSFWLKIDLLEMCFRAVMFNARRKSSTTSNNNLCQEETEKLLRAVKRRQMINKVERKPHVLDKVERSPKVEVVEKRAGVVQSIVKTRRRVVLNNSAGNWSGSSTEEEASDNGEDLASVEQNLAEVREKLAWLKAEKSAAPGGITGSWEERSSQSDEEEFFGIDQEGKAVALKHTSSKEPASSMPEQGGLIIVEESTTEEESENEEAPQSAEFGIQSRTTTRLWSPHTPRSGKREGRGRGKQVNFPCSRWV